MHVPEHVYVAHPLSAYEPSYPSFLASPVGQEPPGVAVGGGIYAGWALISTVSMAAGAYHGYRRNNSVGWAIWWAFMGGLFPVITPVIAFAQGYGQPAKK